MCIGCEPPWLVYVYVSHGCPCPWLVDVCTHSLSGSPPVPPWAVGSWPSEVRSLSGSSPGHPSSQRPCLILFIYKSWLAEQMRRSREPGQSPGRGPGQVCSSHLKPSLASSSRPLSTHTHTHTRGRTRAHMHTGRILNTRPVQWPGRRQGMTRYSISLWKGPVHPSRPRIGVWFLKSFFQMPFWSKRPALWVGNRSPLC